MVFYGFQKTTLIDYPGALASLVFTGGCNFRCPFCYNPELVDIRGTPAFGGEEILEHLQKQVGKIEALCISGGEPLLYADELLRFIEQVKALGLKVKLDTNGSCPQWLKLANVDYIAMDIKTSAKKYAQVLPAKCDIEQMLEHVSESVQFILNSGKEYELRTTVVPGLVTKDDIADIAEKWLPAGVSRYVLSQFRPEITLNKTYRDLIPYSDEMLKEMADICQKKGISCHVRSGYSLASGQHKF